MSVGDRLKKFYQQKGISQIRLAKEIGTSQPYLSGIIKGKRNLGGNVLMKIKERFPDLNEMWLIKGEGEMFREEGSSYKTPENAPVLAEEPSFGYSKENQLFRTDGKSVPYYDTEAIGGTADTADMTPKKYAKTNVGTLLRDAQAAMRVYGDSMLPGYPSGCVIGLRKVEDGVLEWGKVYVVETIDNRYIKRLYKSENGVLCRSDNTRTFENGEAKGEFIYQSFVIPDDTIVRFFRVVGLIKRNENLILN